MPSKSKSPKRSTTQTSHRPWYRRPLVLKLLAIAGLVLIGWIIFLDAQLRYKFEGKRWALPATVYARALEIYEGRALSRNNLLKELADLNYQQQEVAKDPGTYSISGSEISIYSRAHQLPSGQESAARFRFRLTGDQVQQLQALDAQSRTLYTLDPLRIGGIYPQSKEERVLIDYQSIPDGLIAALLATEDRDFYEHWGLSPLSIMRAMWANLRAGKVVQGGSTLTQQLVKNFYLTRDRSLVRKANEAIMAMLLELHYSKQDILETYINDIFLGQSGATAIHGFAMASLFYFGTPLADLRLDQQALLVAIIKGPSYYNPRRYPERARARRNLVLRLMRDEGFIDASYYQTLISRPLSVVDKPVFQTDRFPAFLDLVKRQLRKQYAEDDLKTEGLKIFTTLDPQIQSQVESAMIKVGDDLARRSENEALQGAAVVTGVGTGEVLALVGDRNPRYHGFNRALDASRPIGSLIKPAVYLTALMQKENYHWMTPISDQPFRLDFRNGDSWTPDNFSGETHGDVPMYQALAKSLNIATARLGLDIGLDAVHDTLHKLGIRESLNPYPSLLLGSQNLTPFDVTAFYQTIASGGFEMPLRAIREVSTATGDLLSRYVVEARQNFPPQAIFLLQHGMQEVMRSGTGRSAYQFLPESLHVAGKTGTTNDYRDSWFAGFSGDYLGVVWLGQDDNTPTGLTGASGALKIWRQFIAGIPQYPLSMVKPSDVNYHWFDPERAVLTDERCRGALPLPVWGKMDEISYRPCSKGFNSFGSWLKSWF